MQTLTLKEKEIYDYISENKKQNGYAPSIRDIQKVFGIKSTSTVHTLLSRLEEKGYIHREQGKSRAMRIDENRGETSRTVTIPVLGRVAAGLPILAVENCETYIDFPIMGRGDRSAELFGLRIVGESMIEAGIMNGDIVVVRKENTAEDGDIVVALLDDEATVKRFFRRGNRFCLQPENKSMSPIFTKNLYILGKVIAVIRYYGK